MFEADAGPTRDAEPLPEGNADGPVLLEPLRPSAGLTVRDDPGGTLSFEWRVDAGALETRYTGRRLRTDFCLGIVGETRGCFIVRALPSDATTVTLSLDEIRLKLGLKHARPSRVELRWSLTLALASGGALFSSREFDFVLVPKKGRP